MKSLRQLMVFLLSLLFFINNISAQHYTKSGLPDRRYKENRSSSYSSSNYSTHTRTNRYYSTSYSGVKRDSHGKIIRSESARHSFMRQNGYTRGRKGYVIDHIIPLKRGGCDCPSNMQWQTKEEARRKDKWE